MLKFFSSVLYFCFAILGLILIPGCAPQGPTPNEISPAIPIVSFNVVETPPAQPSICSLPPCPPPGNSLTKSISSQPSTSSQKISTIVPNVPDFPNYFSSVYLPRPQGFNSPAFFNPFLYGCGDILECPRVFYAQYRYSKTLFKENLARYLFGSPVLGFQGSLVKNRSNTNLIADFFGLDPLYSGGIQFKPVITQHYFDLSLRVDLKNYFEKCKNLWLEFDTTLVHANWNLNATTAMEKTSNISSISFINSFPWDHQGPPGYPGYMQAGSTTFANRLSKVLGGNFLFGDMQTKWRYGKFNLNGISKTGLADINVLFGYDFINCDSHHFTAFAKVTAPTGTKLDQKHAEYIFNPIIGNGHYWGLGGGLSGHFDILRCNDSCVSFYINGSIVHLFKNTQWRTFDFKKYGPLSRYMLLKEIKNNGNSAEDYAGNLINAVNYTTREIKSSFDVQGDLTLQLLYKNCGWAVGLGYNVYGRSQEKIRPSKTPNAIDLKHFGAKGNTGAYTLCVDSFTNVASFEPNNSTQTESSNLTATMVPQNSITGLDNSTAITLAQTQCGLPNILETWDEATHTRYSNPAIFVTPNDINFKPIPKQIIHKAFFHVDYLWQNCEWEPYFGVYGEIDEEAMRDIGLVTQWGIGIRGGISF